MEAISGEHHISGVYTKLLMEFVVETMGPDQIEELLRGAGETRSLAELSDASSWSSYLQFRRLLEERSRLASTGLYEQSEPLSAWPRGRVTSQAAETLASPGALLAVVSTLNPLVP